MTLPSPRAVVPARAQCSVCRRPADGGSLRCENCQGRAHRRCLGLAAGAYPGGWFWCCHCLLAEAGLQPGQGGPYVAGLADQVVNLAGSAVGGSSAVTYEAHRRRYLEFVTESLGASAETAFPTERGKDLNRVVVCLFIVHASSRWSRSTIEGTLSALADWQRSRGVPASGYIRQDPMVQRTLAQALRARVGVMAAGPKAKAGMPVSMLRILIDWLAAKVQVAPGDSAEREQDACWLVLGFFGMLRRSELAGLQVGDVRELPGGGLAVAIRRSKTDQLGVGAVVHLADVSGSGVRIGQLVARQRRHDDIRCRLAFGLAPELAGHDGVIHVAAQRDVPAIAGAADHAQIKVRPERHGHIALEDHRLALVFEGAGPPRHGMPARGELARQEARAHRTHFVSDRHRLAGLQQPDVQAAPPLPVKSCGMRRRTQYAPRSGYQNNRDEYRRRRPDGRRSPWSSRTRLASRSVIMRDKPPAISTLRRYSGPRTASATPKTECE